MCGGKVNPPRNGTFLSTQEYVFPPRFRTFPASFAPIASRQVKAQGAFTLSVLKSSSHASPFAQQPQQQWWPMSC